MRFVRFVDAVAGLAASRLQPQWGILEDERVLPLAAAPYAAANREGVRIAGGPRALAEVRLAAPVTPSKVICVGRNYAEHAAEFGNEAPPEPLIFLKPPTSIVGPDAEVVHPAISERVDHEGELAVVIARRGRRLQEAEALGVIFGYTVANDVTARDLQRKDGQWTRGKGFDTFGPVGPWIDTAYDPAGKVLRCSVNGAVRQKSSMDLMIHSVARILSYVSEFMTLEPGDLVMTGTPAGVGPVQPGDEMVVQIEGLGALRNPVVADDAGPA